jgi:hypothetical protein
MRLALYASCAIALLFGGMGCATHGTVGGGAVPGAVVTVQYVNPQNFTDFSVQGRDVQSAFTREVMQTLEPVMKSRFPAYMLTLQFTNIDLAGRTTAGPRTVRVVRTITQPASRLIMCYRINRDTRQRPAREHSLNRHRQVAPVVLAH